MIITPLEISIPVFFYVDGNSLIHAQPHVLLHIPIFSYIDGYSIIHTHPISSYGNDYPIIQTHFLLDTFPYTDDYSTIHTLSRFLWHVLTLSHLLLPFICLKRIE